MKSIGVTDELVGGLAQRMELHEQGARLARRTYDDAILAGEDREKALAMAQVEADKLLTERPHDIEASTESWRKQVTLQSDIKKVGAMGNAMWWSNRIMKMPPIKPLVLFSKSLLTATQCLKAAGRFMRMGLLLGRGQVTQKKKTLGGLWGGNPFRL
jgi:hypothetical protein